MSEDDTDHEDDIPDLRSGSSSDEEWIPASEVRRRLSGVQRSEARGVQSSTAIRQRIHRALRSAHQEVSIRQTTKSKYGYVTHVFGVCVRESVTLGIGNAAPNCCNLSSPRESPACGSAACSSLGQRSRVGRKL
jgi:hypothetical protein